MKLIKVDVLPEASPPGGWALHAPSGHSLHVSETMTLDELDSVLRALGLRGHR